jgi:hypothetical protein
VAGVSLFFKTTTAVRNEAIREFNQAIAENTTDFSQKAYMKQDAVITSEEEFLGIRHSNPYENAPTKMWASVAYIDRAEAARIYEAKITANMNTIKALIADGGGEKEALYACALLHRALPIADVTEEWIQTASVVDPEGAQKYGAHQDTIQELRRLYRQKREGLTFSVVTTKDDFAGRVERKVSELLEDNGYTITDAAAHYQITVKVTATEEEYEAGIFGNGKLNPRLVLTTEGKAITLEHKGSGLGIDTLPQWISEYMDRGVPGVEAMTDFTGKYCIVAEEYGPQLQPLLTWVNNFNAQQQIGAQISTRVASVFKAHESKLPDDDASIRKYDNAINTLVTATYTGARKESDWWVKQQIVQKGQADEIRYRAMALYTIDRKVLNQRSNHGNLGRRNQGGR